MESFDQVREHLSSLFSRVSEYTRAIAPLTASLAANAGLGACSLYTCRSGCTTYFLVSLVYILYILIKLYSLIYYVFALWLVNFSFFGLSFCVKFKLNLNFEFRLQIEFFFKIIMVRFTMTLLAVCDTTCAYLYHV